MLAIILLQLLALHLLLTVPHELGHFAVARLVRVAVPEFGIGFPPTVVAVRWRGTRWSLNLLPLGAFVGYRAGQGNVLRRSAIAAAGPLANFLVALVCLAFLVTPDSPGLFGLLGLAVHHLSLGLANPFGGDPIVTLGGFTLPALSRDLTHWMGAREFMRDTLAASVVIGAMNLLPLPPLDGSKPLFLILRRLGCPPTLERRAGRYGLVGVAALTIVLPVFARVVATG